MLAGLINRGLVAAVLLVLVAGPARAVDPPDEEASGRAASVPHYVIARDATLYSSESLEKPYMELRFREKVYVIEDGIGWSRVRTADGAEGYVSAAALSNAWLRVSKSDGAIYAYRGTELVHRIAADFGNNTFADKQQRGDRLNPDHWRTPEGIFFVARKNPRSQFYKAFVLNYPTPEDAARGLRQGLISRREHDAIVQATERFQVPPMYTSLGGWIEIHGHGTGSGVNWTQGCVAIPDEVIDDLWNWVEVGTPVLIEP